MIEAKRHLPDIIVCDIMMPELDGYGVLNVLSKQKETKQIPFIFLSAKQNEVISEKVWIWVPMII